MGSTVCLLFATRRLMGKFCKNFLVDTKIHFDNIFMVATDVDIYLFHQERYTNGGYQE